MKFKTFLKIFSISLASLLGVFAIGYGIMYAVGAFSEPDVQPNEIYFEFSEYNVDGDFYVKVLTTTEDVTKTELTLSLISDNSVEKNGRISDGVISIPKYAKIGEDILVNVEKNINDAECDGQDWIKGGHSVIRATSTNPLCDSARTNINVDVPVYKIEVETRVSEQDQDSNVFAINSNFYASLKFYPQRSAYQFSFDGQNGYEEMYKNSYFMLQSNNDEYIVQNGTTNNFTAVKVGNNSTIVGYAFASTVIENDVLKLYEDKTEEAKYSLIMNDLENMSTSTEDANRRAVKNTKTVNVVDIDVDTMNVLGGIKDVNINTRHTLYANKIVDVNNEFASNLGIQLSSSLDTSVSLQSKLSNVGIAFLYKQGNSYVNATENENASYNIINIPQGSYSKKVTLSSNGYTYYFPVITSSVDNYYWEFAVSQYCDVDSLSIEIKYFDDELDISTVTKSFITKSVISSPISWNSLNEIELKVFDGNEIEFQEYNLTERAQVPTANLYQTKKYFAYTNETNISLTDYIYCEEGVSYNLGLQNYVLYELPDGIVKAKGINAHGISFNVVFVTVETDYKAEEILQDGKYVINQYSQDDIGAVSAIEVVITKTLHTVSGTIETNGEDADLILYPEQNPNAIAFVQNSSNPFDIVVGCGNSNNEVENAIFKQAIQDNEITIVAKINDVETDLIENINVVEQTETDLKYRFSMKINELPVGVSELRVKLYIRYVKSSDKVVDIPVTSCVTKSQIVKLDYVEVYSGEATTFAFNLNIADEGSNQTSSDNRVLVTSNITQTNDNIDDISVTYLLNGVDISSLLFTNNNGYIDFTSVNVVVQDKYGKKPLSSNYTLKSRNQNILVVGGQSSISFVGQGDVELELCDSNNVVKDVLYFTAQKSGQVYKVDKLVENYNQDSGETSKVNVQEYLLEPDNPYAFPQITIPVIGYQGSTINLNSTDNNVVNLLTYYYQYTNANGVKVVGNLTAKMKFSFVADSEEIEELDKVIEYTLTNDTNNFIRFKKDFGQRKTIQLLVTVPELGISQVVVIDVKPNIEVYVTPQNNPVADSLYGIQVYNGVYSDTIYSVKVEMRYAVKSSTTNDVVLDSSSYAFFVFDEQSGTKEQLSNNGGTFAYIAKTNKDDTTITTEFERTELSNRSCVFNVNIVFNNLNQFKPLILSFEKIGGVDDINKTAYDASQKLYIYVNPNIKVEVDTDILYLETKNENEETYKVYGQYTIFGNETSIEYPIRISRIVNNSDEIDTNIAKIDYSKISFNIISGDNFIIENNILKCTAILDSTTQITLEALYDGFNIGETKMGNKNYFTLTLSPNIQKDFESKNWVLYNGEYYLTLVNGKIYDQDTIKNSFIVDDTSISVSFIPDNTQYINNADGNITVQNVSDRLVFESENNQPFILKVQLSNGYSMEFKVMLVPSDLPYVIYRDAEGNILDTSSEDLAVMLNVEDENFDRDKYCYVLTGAGSEEGTKVTYTLDSNNSIPLNAIGIQAIDGATYTVKNLDENDKYVYAYYDNATNTLKTVPVGKDTYIILYANLNSLSSSSLVISYLINIKKELEIKMYYPYLDGQSSNVSEISGTPLIVSEPTFDMEYLSFDENNVATLDMLQNLDNTVPNKSPLNSRRIAISRPVYDAENGEYVDELVNQANIYFNVTELHYYSFGWKTAQNISSYATFNGSVLTVKANDSTKIRLKIEITTDSGVVGWYYVSVGEIPQMSLTQTDQGIQTTDIKDISFTANTEYYLNIYRLTQEENYIVKDITSELKFYTPSDRLIIKNSDTDETIKCLTADATTKNYIATLLLFTKYGSLKTINVNILSNYIVTANKNEVYSGTIINMVDKGDNIDEEFFSARKINEDGDEESIKKLGVNAVNVIECSQENYNSFLTVDLANGTIKIGAVTEIVVIKLEILFNLGKETVNDEEQDIIFTYQYTLTINPSIRVEDYNGEIISRNNQYDLGEISSNDVNQIEIEKLFRYIGDENITFNKWIDDVVTNNISGFNMSVISEISAKDLYGAELEQNDSDEYVISLTVPKVAERTLVSIKVDFINICQDGNYVIFSSYFVFIVTPDFTVNVNYPKPSESVNLTREYLYIGANPDESIAFSLSETATLAENARVVVNNADNSAVADETTLANIYVGVTSENCTVTNGDVPVTSSDKLKFTDNPQFKFIDCSHQGEVVFTIYYGVDLNKDTVPEQYVAVGTYLLSVTKNINDVWSVNSINFNNSNNSQNSAQNYESIYIGNNDNIMNKIEVQFNVPENAVISNSVYLEIQSIGGNDVVMDSRVEINSQNKNELFTTYITVKNVPESFESNELVYKFYDSADGKNEVSIFDAQGQELGIDIESIKSRVNLKYYGYDIDFYKAYNILDVSVLNITVDGVSEEDELQQQIQIKDIANIGTYYVKYIFDIVFEKQNIELSTGQSINLLNENSLITDTTNHFFDIGMKRISNGVYYQVSDFAFDGLQFEIESVEGNSYGYLQNIPYSAGDANKQYVYDYRFLAMGAPNESKVVVVNLLVKFGDVSKLFKFEFTISNDYEQLTLRNQDNTINSQTNRNRIIVNTPVVFAVAGSENAIENFVFLTHRNDIVGIEKGNMAVYFNVTIDQGGKYVTKREQTSQNMDLVFTFAQIQFGDVNVDFTFTDDYGYTFTYYVTIVAQYNTIYTGGAVSVYELDEIQLVDEGASSQGAGDVNIPISIQKKNELIQDVDFNDLEFSYEFISSDNVDLTDIAIQNVNGNTFEIGILGNDVFDSSTAIVGVLRILVNLAGSNENASPLSITLTIRQRYSLNIPEEENYVRDGISFSLLDVVDVVDNKVSVNVAERTLKNVDTAYIEYELKKGDISYSLEDSQVINDGISFTLGIQAYNTTTGKTTSIAISDKTKITYTSLQSLFNLESIKNYQFRLVYWDINGNFGTFKDVATNSEYILEEYDSVNVQTKESTTLKIIMKSDGSGDVDTGYTIKIKNSYIIKDQEFSIGLREINNNPNLNVYFSNNKILQIKANVNEKVSYSLYANNIIQSGEYVSLLTDISKDIINGLTSDDGARLKGIKFSVSTSAQTNVAVTGNKGTVSLTSDGEFLTSSDGNNIEYQNANMILDVSYGLFNGQYMNNETNVNVPLRVTLKYVAVNKQLAYAGNVSRKVSSTGTTFDINTWAGTTYRQFTLVTGYSNATSYVTSEDLTLSSNASDFVFTLNSSQSSDGSMDNFVTINQSTINLSEDFNFEDNYVAIDIAVKYGDDKSKSRKIDTVLLSFSSPNPKNVEFTSDKLFLTNSDGSYYLQMDNLLKILKIYDENGYLWSYQDLKLLNNVLVAFGNDTTKKLEVLLTRSDDLNLSDCIDENEQIDITVKLNQTGEEIGESTLKITNSLFEADCIIQNGPYNYKVQLGDESEKDIAEQILNVVTFKDIYGYENVCSLDSNNIVTYDCTTNSTDGLTNGATKYVTYTFKQGLVVLGQVDVYVYESSDLFNAQTSITDQVGEVEIWDSDDINYNYVVTAYGYQEVEIGLDSNEQPITQKQIIIPKSAINGLNNIISTQISEQDVVLNTSVDEENITITGIENLQNCVIKLSYQDIYGVTNQFSFVYLNKQDSLLSLQRPTFNNIFDWISYLYNVDSSKLLVRLNATSSDEAKLQLNEVSGNYNLTINSQLNSGFSVEIYQSFIDINGEIQEIVYFRNNFTLI